MTGEVRFDELTGYADWVEAHDAWLANQVHQPNRRAVMGPAEPSAPLVSVCLISRPSQPDDTAGRAMQVLAGQSFGAWEGFITAAQTSIPARVSLFTDGLTEIEQCCHVLDHASGRYVLVVPPGTLPSPHILWLLADAVLGDPAVVYTDSDGLDGTGRRVAPRLRTGWDPELLLAGDALGSVYAVRTDLARRAGGYRSRGTLQASLLDLLIRVAAMCPPSSIHHVPAVLWHKVSSFDRARPADGEAARAVVKQALREQGLRAVVDPAPLLPTASLVRWALPSPPPAVSIIVPVRDRADLLARCADGVLHRTDYPALELLIVDNGSTEPDSLRLLADLAKDARVRVLAFPGPFNFSALNNQAVIQARGDVVVFLNNDTDVIGPDWLTELVGQALRPEIGAVGAKLIYPDGRVQHCGLWTGPNVVGHQFRFAGRQDPGPLGELAVCRTVLAVTGACLAMRKAVFLEVGGFDEDRFKIAFNDVDLCLRLGDFGYRVVCTPAAELVHLESVTRGLDDTPEKSALAHAEFANFRELWDVLLDGDPFYSPHLVFGWDGVALSTAQFEAVPARRTGVAASLDRAGLPGPPITASERCICRAAGRARQARQQAHRYNREADALRSRLASQQVLLADLHATASTLERDVITLTQERGQLEARYRQVVQSTTWKASWPLRYLASRPWRRLFRAPPS